MASAYDEHGRRVSDGVKNQVGEDLVDKVFYDTRLTIDEPSDENILEGLSRTGSGLKEEKHKNFGWNEAADWRFSKGDRQERERYRNTFGSDQKVGCRPHYRRRSKHAMREFDKDLNAFNKYAQNGLLLLAALALVLPCTSFDIVNLLH